MVGICTYMVVKLYRTKDTQMSVSEMGNLSKIKRTVSMSVCRLWYCAVVIHVIVRKLGQRYTTSLHYFLTSACESAVISRHLVKNQLAIFEYFWTPLIYVSILLPTPHSLHYWNFLISLPTLFFLRIILAILYKCLSL